MINLSVLLITQFQILKKNFKILIITSFLLGFNMVYSQNNSQELDSLDINKEDKKPLLLDNIKYDATDSIIIDQKNNNLTLELIAIDFLKNRDKYEIILIFSNNAHISLTTETIEVRLEDQNLV